MRKRNGSRGVTLIELCFGLAIVAILTGLAVPSMRGALRAGAVRSATLELLAGVQQTRASSIVEARPGTLCLSDAAGDCLRGNGPASSWQAFLRGRRTAAAAGRAHPARGRGVARLAAAAGLLARRLRRQHHHPNYLRCAGRHAAARHRHQPDRTRAARRGGASGAARHELARAWLHAGGDR